MPSCGSHDDTLWTKWQAFTVMATVCTGLSLPLLAVSYAKARHS